MHTTCCLGGSPHGLPRQQRSTSHAFICMFGPQGGRNHTAYVTMWANVLLLCFELHILGDLLVLGMKSDIFWLYGTCMLCPCFR